KHVINDNGASDANLIAGQFTLQVNVNSQVFQYIAGNETGTLLELPRGASYSIVESTNPAPAYAVSYSSDCTGTVLAGELKTCTATNDDVGPPPPPSAITASPDYTVTEDNTVSSAVPGSGQHTYTFTTALTGTLSFIVVSSGVAVRNTDGTYTFCD